MNKIFTIGVNEVLWIFLPSSLHHKKKFSFYPCQLQVICTIDTIYFSRLTLFILFEACSAWLFWWIELMKAITCYSSHLDFLGKWALTKFSAKHWILSVCFKICKCWYLQKMLAFDKWNPKIYLRIFLDLTSWYWVLSRV